MKRILILGLFAGYSAIRGAVAADAQQTNEATPPRTKTINIGRGIQDWLIILSDGSGTVGYGAGGAYQGHFKAGTFNVGEVKKQLLNLPLDEKGEWRTHYSFEFGVAGKMNEAIPKYYTLERKLIPSLFETAIRASGMKKGDFPAGFGLLPPLPTK